MSLSSDPKPVGILMHPAAALHDTGWGHPEHQGRLRELTRALRADAETLGPRVRQIEARPARVEDLLLVHEEGLIRQVKEQTQRARDLGRPVALAENTYVSARSFDAAIGSSGAALEAARLVWDGELDAAFAATRPPGHHATQSQAMGFCLFNHVAAAARWLRSSGGAKRVLIVDWDVHHGNGTQEIFYEDDSVFFLSLHQSPHYPGTGAASERGRGRGLGATLNVPLPAGTPRERYLECFSEALHQATSDFRPQIVLISCGFDVLRGDPLGGQLLEPEDLHALTREVADELGRAGGRGLVVLLEGGYDPARLGEGSAQVVRALASLPA